jgi:hypothetical protein
MNMTSRIGDFHQYGRSDKTLKCSRLVPWNLQM